MSMAFLFPPNLSPPFLTTPSKNTTSPNASPLFTSQHHNKHHQRDFSLLLAAASTSSSPIINADYLDREFGGHGVSFEGIGDSCVVKMGLENGSTATVMLPSGLITSYKPHMWHGGTVEVLHTSVSEGGGRDGEVVVQGGVSLGFSFATVEGFSWSPSNWALHDVKGSSEKAVQVELISVDPEGTVEIKYLVTLQQGVLGSELIVTNLKSPPVQFLGSVISHLKVSTPDATYAVGLQGADYLSKKPLQSGFSIIPPDFGRKRLSSNYQSWGQKALQGLFSGLTSGRIEKGNEIGDEGEIAEEDKEGEEKDNLAQMTEKMSRIYTCAPREFTVIDRGRRNSVVVERIGFDEFYVFSPGSDHEWYGKYAYVCIGPSAMLMPVTLGSQDVWSGGQYLHNPNL